MLGFPKSLEEARVYRYFKWAGNPTGTAYDESRCAYQVWASGRWIHAYQCLRKPGHGPAALYCKQHSRKVNV